MKRGTDLVSTTPISITTMEIRPATNADCDEIWKIFHEIIMTGDTYAFDPKMSREEAVAYWFRADTHAYVAEKDGGVVGTYILRPNQAGPGSHVANAAFMVAPNAQASGVGRRMAEHCLSEARRMGFRAMQFNFVVSTNARAIRLWKRLGFEIVGTLPGAFWHPQKGYVDVYVMYRSLLNE
jgi:L-amino acid N-acyltransferase YncA